MGSRSRRRRRRQAERSSTSGGAEGVGCSWRQSRARQRRGDGGPRPPNPASLTLQLPFLARYILRTPHPPAPTMYARGARYTRGTVARSTPRRAPCGDAVAHGAAQHVLWVPSWPQHPGPAAQHNQQQLRLIALHPTPQVSCARPTPPYGLNDQRIWERARGRRAHGSI